MVHWLGTFNLPKIIKEFLNFIVKYRWLTMVRNPMEDTLRQTSVRINNKHTLCF